MLLTPDLDAGRIEVVPLVFPHHIALAQVPNTGSEASLDPSGGLLLIPTHSPDFGSSAPIVQLNLRDHTNRPVPHSEDCHSPSWSPDGSAFLAVCSSPDPTYGARLDILLFPTTDSAPVTLTAGPYAGEGYSNPSWSADAQSIAYIIESGGQVPGPQDGLYVVPAACVTDHTDCLAQSARIVAGTLYHARWSPQGHALAYDDRNAIVIYSPTEGQLARVELPGLVTSLAWSPTAANIVAVTWDVEGGLEDVLLIDLADDSVKPLLRYIRETYAVAWITLP